MITPEVGCNFRPAVITTNIPMATDKPIDIGVDDFCLHCKVCAEQCPSGAIPMGDKVEVRGYRRWKIDTAKCQNFWTSNSGEHGVPDLRERLPLYEEGELASQDGHEGVGQRSHGAFREAPDHHAEEFLSWSGSAGLLHALPGREERFLP